MLICLFGHLGAFGLVGPDEPRYVWIARAMAQTGDWVTPRLFGRPWFEKPPLYYWTAAIGFRLYLSAEWAARLPSAFAALGAALCIGWIGWKWYGSREFCPWSPALLAPLIFSTSVATVGFARAGAPDMLFAASITFAMASAAIVLAEAGILRSPAKDVDAMASNQSRIATACFGAFAGLGVLAKGPAAIILVGGAILLWALVTRQWPAVIRLFHPYAIGPFCLVAFPWYVLCALRNPDFVRVFIIEHNFARYLTPVFQHRQPFWFFVPITLLAMLPWSIFVIPAARDGWRLWREKAWQNSPGFFFACWAFFPILFFSFSQSKLPGYILPAIPPLALLISISLAREIERHSTLGTRGFALLGVTWIGLAAGALVWVHRLPAAAAAQIHTIVMACAMIATGAGVAIGIVAFAHRRATIWISLAVVSLAVEAAGIGVLPKLDPYDSARAAGTLLRADLCPDRLFIYNLPRAWEYGLDFYLGREVREWSAADRQAALVLTSPRGFEELQKDGYFRGTLEEPYPGIVFVPIPARPAMTP
jgi:4-amino-4-deoxy-L-arabinose transferase-like glycosyltransferase